VQAVGQLDQDDAHIARHRQQHLAEALGLRCSLLANCDAVELGQAIDQIGHLRAEALDQLLILVTPGVLHHVVQQRRHQASASSFQSHRSRRPRSDARCRARRWSGTAPGAPRR
jgi:hypothetical protein